MAASDAELIRRAMRLGGRGGDSERGICRSASGGDCAADKIHVLNAVGDGVRAAKGSSENCLAGKDIWSLG